MAAAPAAAPPVDAKPSEVDRRKSGNPRHRGFVRGSSAAASARSPTFRQEVLALEGTDVIVLVEPAARMPPGLIGYLAYVTTARSSRIVRILFDPHRGPTRPSRSSGTSCSTRSRSRRTRRSWTPARWARCTERIGWRESLRCRRMRCSIRPRPSRPDTLILRELGRAAARGGRRPTPPGAEARRGQWEVFSSGSRTMNQLSQSMREPPASVTVKARLSDGISQRCLARPDSSGTR